MRTYKPRPKTERPCAACGRTIKGRADVQRCPQCRWRLAQQQRRARIKSASSEAPSSKD